MTPENAYIFPEAYTRIVLGTTASPGKCVLSGHDRKEAWDEQQPKGSAGASNKLNGRPIGKFRATFTLADQEEIDAWASFQRLIESTTSGTTPTALPVYHPDLALNGFTEVSNGGVGGLVRDDRGGATVTVDFVEYRPPAPAPPPAAQARGGTTGSAAPTGAGPGGTGGDGYDPNRAARQEFAELWDEAAA